VSFTESAALPTVSLAVPEPAAVSPVALAEGEADGVGLALDVSEPAEPEAEPPVRTPVRASPMESSSPPPPDGDAVAVSEEDAEADGAGVALSSEPESGEEVLPAEPVASEDPGEPPVSADFRADFCVSAACASEDADGEGVAESPPEALAEGEGLAEAVGESSSAATQSLYSSAVRLRDDVAEGWSAASASVGVNPIPMRTAVGIAATAIALPAGI
jgi:hypothetical protein